MSTIYRNLIRFVIYQSVIIIFTSPQYINAQKLGVDPFFDSIYNVAHTLHDTARVRSFANLASMVISNDASLAKRYLDTAKMIHARHPTHTNELKITYEEAAYQTTIAHFEEAYQLYKKSVTLAESLDRRELAADFCSSVGDMMVEMGRFAEAETYYLESLEKTKWHEANFANYADPDKRFTDIYALYANAYLKLAKCYKKMPQKRSQIEVCLKNALDNTRKVHPVYVAEAHFAFAEYYLEQKDATRAGLSIAELEKIYETYKAEQSASMPWYSDMPYLKGLLAKIKGNTEGAIVYLNQAVLNFEKGGDVKKLSATYKDLTELYRSAGDFSKAFEAQSKYIVYNDSLTRKEQFATINTLETQFQTQKKQVQIEQQNAEIASRKRIQWGLLAGLVLFGAFSFLLYRQNQRIKSANEKNKKQATQLALMMKELHHRVKNNLQLVSSLLSLQSFQLADKSAAAAIQEGQTRVEAMSLIHQRLYQTKDVTELNFSNYAQDLVEKLVYAFGIDPHNFDLNLNISDENLDVDYAMPLGLILNELLTNSFKYAFSKTEKSALSIDLQKVNDKWQFHYADNGAGSASLSNGENKDGFGTKLIMSLSQQLEGHHRFWNDNGLHFELKF